ncbi:hypothetical protein ACFQ68_18730 [Amycolatopsis japonica]|uniref:hypothetical protein n=1 Tax=Amycolatopsis japonica TaxID=208439 RepID=UPI00366E4F22
MSTSESRSVEIRPAPLGHARYVLAPNGLLLRRGELPPFNHHPYAELTGAADVHLPVTYDCHTARDTAAQLLGYSRQFYTQESLPDSMSVVLLDPTNRSTSSTTWLLVPGLTLTYHAPFTASLDADIDTWVLTPALATRWARALLALAAELDHATAVAAHAVLASRSGASPTDNIRVWAQRLAHDERNNDVSIVQALLDILDEEDEAILAGTRLSALDIANPDLPTALTALHLDSEQILTHLDAADTIRDLANRYGIPLFMWTEKHWWLARHLSVGELTEQEWRRFTSSAEVQDFPLHVEQRQTDGCGIDFELALKQAGLSCRKCSIRIRGEIDETYGHCEYCLPSDRTAALTKALERGCLAEPFERGIGSHSGAPGTACEVCGLPLPSKDCETDSQCD